MVYYLDECTVSKTLAQSLSAKIRQEDWQIECAAEMLTGNDCMVHKQKTEKLKYIAFFACEMEI